MGEGSPEVPEAVAEAMAAESDALSDLGELDAGPSLFPTDEGSQAEATEPAEAEPETPKQTAPEATEPPKPDGEVGSETPEGGGEKSSEETGPDLSYLPGNLKEALEGKSAEDQREHIAVYKSMERHFHDTNRENAARARENEQLINYGKTWEAVALNKEARAHLDQALDIVEAGSEPSPEAELERLENAITDAEDDAAYRLAVRHHATYVARREVQNAQREARAPIERGQEATVRASALVKEMAIPIEKAEPAWQALQRDAEADGFEITPDNVRILLRPYLRQIAFSPNGLPPAPTVTKPSGPKGGGTARPDVNAERPRRARTPRNVEEMAAMARERSDLTDADFAGLGAGESSGSDFGDTL